MKADFVHLRLHSEFSLIDGLVRIKPLITAVSDRAMPAVAVTDVTNFFALVKSYTCACSTMAMTSKVASYYC
jgi:DNA polymerase-3 subunit alpha